MSLNTNGSQMLVAKDKDGAEQEHERRLGAASALFRRFLPDVVMLQETWMPRKAPQRGLGTEAEEAQLAIAARNLCTRRFCNTLEFICNIIYF